MKPILYFLIITITFFISCDANKVSFTEKFPKRKKDISLKLGEKFKIKRNKDTLVFIVDFDSRTKNNVIIDSENDTVFYGTVSKYKGLYYFDYQLNDTSYWIYAVDIETNLFSDKMIRGLFSSSEQIEFLKKELDKGRFKKLIKSYNRETGIYRLFPDKKIMNDFYSSVIDSFAFDTLILDDDFFIDSTKISFVEQQVTQILKVKSGELIQKVYPNPFDNEINIEMLYNSDFNYELIDISGKSLNKGEFSGVKTKLEINTNYSGVCILRIYDTKSDKMFSKTLLKN